MKNSLFLHTKYGNHSSFRSCNFRSTTAIRRFLRQRFLKQVYTSCILQKGGRAFSDSLHCINTNIPSRLFKEFAFELATLVATIFNVSLSSGVLPISWKESYLTPIPKITKPMCESDITVNDLGRAMSPNFGT